MLIGVLIFSVLASYVGSYYRLSRRGMAEAAAVLEAEGFFYVPLDELFASRDLTRHSWLTTLYAPLNWIDRKLFGGDGPAGGIMFHLSYSIHPPPNTRSPS